MNDTRPEVQAVRLPDRSDIYRITEVRSMSLYTLVREWRRCLALVQERRTAAEADRAQAGADQLLREARTRSEADHGPFNIRVKMRAEATARTEVKNALEYVGDGDVLAGLAEKLARSIRELDAYVLDR